MGRYISEFEIFVCLVHRERVVSPPDLIKLPDTGLWKNEGLKRAPFWGNIENLGVIIDVYFKRTNNNEDIQRFIYELYIEVRY